MLEAVALEPHVGGDRGDESKDQENSEEHENLTVHHLLHRRPLERDGGGIEHELRLVPCEHHQT